MSYMGVPKGVWKKLMGGTVKNSNPVSTIDGPSTFLINTCTGSFIAEAKETTKLNQTKILWFLKKENPVFYSTQKQYILTQVSAFTYLKYNVVLTVCLHSYVVLTHALVCFHHWAFPSNWNILRVHKLQKDCSLHKLYFWAQ